MDAITILNTLFKNKLKKINLLKSEFICLQKLKV